MKEDRGGAGAFARRFGRAPEVVASAPGRVNLMGDHTDYNDGLVLPIAIPHRTFVELSVGRHRHEVFADTFEETAVFTSRDPLPAGFARYVAGCIRVLEQEGIEVPPLRMAITSRVPLRAGLSSSAALAVATLRAIDARLALSLDAVRIAVLARRVEVEHVGVACGMMDQMAASLAHEDRMLFLDTRDLTYELLPLPDGAELLVMNSGVERALETVAYNERREECRAAAAALGVASLRAVTDVEVLSWLPETLRRRARHVLTENLRVATAARADAATFGRAMNESHTSLREDYEVTVPAVDRLVAELAGRPEVLGARMTGAGFGGACVALCVTGSAEAVGSRVLASAPDERRAIVVPITGGVTPPRRLRPASTAAQGGTSRARKPERG